MAISSCITRVAYPIVPERSTRKLDEALDATYTLVYVIFVVVQLTAAKVSHVDCKDRKIIYKHQALHTRYGYHSSISNADIAGVAFHKV